HASSGQLVVTGWEIDGVDPSDPAEVSRCLCECQLAALEVLAFCREHVPGYEHCRIERLPSLLGTRESRRIVGEYILTGDDVVAGRKFADGIARCCFFVDLHDSPPGISIPFPMDYKRATMPPPDDWYEIPYRCLIPSGVSGLLVAGRCISCDRPAQGSMRLQPTCMYLGEAAGIGAGIAVSENRPPEQADGPAVRREIGM
ncbi:MAG: FAD-dependent oxidoreductase, partial [Lentisphaerae bacterium]|nr:FAD-dependent oxidoreductase [Lentisphaerota bacterium]